MKVCRVSRKIQLEIEELKCKIWGSIVQSRHSFCRLISCQTDVSTEDQPALWIEKLDWTEFDRISRICLQCPVCILLHKVMKFFIHKNGDGISNSRPSDRHQLDVIDQTFSCMIYSNWRWSECLCYLVGKIVGGGSIWRHHLTGIGTAIIRIRQDCLIIIGLWYLAVGHSADVSVHSTHLSIGRGSTVG